MDFGKSGGGRSLGNRFILCNRSDRDQRTHVHLRPFHDNRLGSRDKASTPDE
jgi:hypothetical protein